APRDLTSSRFFVLHTAVTSAPKYRASCTPAVPMAPDAPKMRIFFPSRRSASLRHHSALSPPSQIVAASSKLNPAGLYAILAFSDLQMNSARATNLHPAR